MRCWPINRRGALTLGAGALIGAGGVSTALFEAHDDPVVLPRPLKWHAERKGLSFGTCVVAGRLSPGGALPRLIAAEADMIVPAFEMKWGSTEQVRDRPDYGAAERIASFAAVNGLRLRGHAAVWYRNIPTWAQPLLHGPSGPRLLIEHVRQIVGHFRGRVVEWDVLNEAIEPFDNQPGLFRKEPLGRPLSIGLIADLFAAAHDADPGARLFYNDYMLEGVLPYEDRKRTAILAMLQELKRRGAPIHGLGVQSHLATHLRFSPSPFRSFLAAVASLGLEIRLTELDVTDRKTPGTVEQRDRQIADLALSFLQTAFDERAVKGLVTWGLLDKDAYQLPTLQRADGLEMRPLPFDDQLRRKPLWTAIARAFDGAPPR